MFVIAGIGFQNTEKNILAIVAAIVLGFFAIYDSDKIKTI
jgi:hypothetical protein